MLDALAATWAHANEGADIWADPSVTFLDPFTKSGVFLREVARRLTEGLSDAIPVLAERVDHILTRQVYGIGITQLTALLATGIAAFRGSSGPERDLAAVLLAFQATLLVALAIDWTGRWQ